MIHLYRGGSDKLKGRHEHKFYINHADYFQLRSRLRVIAKADQNTDENGGYKIRSLYFDNYADKAVMEKQAGINRREKYRIRYYNDNTEFIRLEKKSKVNTLSYKTNVPITKQQCESLLQGDYECLKDENTPLMMELYSKIHTELLRPKNIVDYEREVYVYPTGNVRITFDKNIRMSNSVQQFLDPNSVMIPSANAFILEIKYDGFLPEIIRDILQVDRRVQTEFSKYVVSRMV